MITLRRLTSSFVLLAGVAFAYCLSAYSAYAQVFWAHRTLVLIDVPYGDEPHQKLDRYIQGQRLARSSYPEFSDTPHPTFIWYHGGGWLRGDKAEDFNQTLEFLQRGWHAVNVNFNQEPGSAPQAVDDAMCAYKWIVDEAHRTGQSDYFVVSGASSGGHLALMVGLLNTTGDHPCRTDTPPAAIVNWFGVTDIELLSQTLADVRPDRNYLLNWVGSSERLAELAPRISPTEFVTADAPPIITIHGTADDDVLFQHATSLHGTLTTRNRLVALEGGTHGGFTEEQYVEAISAIFEFLGISP